VAEQGRDPLLQQVDRGVLAVDVVADLGPAMAWRMAGVGRLTVSLRRSTTGPLAGALTAAVPGVRVRRSSR
jgi:hypothetical protein